MESKARLCGRLVNHQGPFQLHKLFENLVLVDKDGISSQPAIFSDGSWTTFLEIYQASRALSQRLVRFGLENKFQANADGDYIIAICMEHSLELVISLLAVFQSGAAYLPLDLKFPPGRVQHILRDSRPIFCLTRKIPAEFEALLSAECPVFDYDGISGTPGIPGEDCLLTGSLIDDSKLLAAVLYTSGSTGIPKGVRLEHGTIVHRLNWQWRTFPFAPGEAACFKTALTFVDSIAEVWAPLLQGVPVVVIRKEQTQNTEDFVQLLENSRISRLVLVPSLLQAILFDLKRRDGRILEHLKTWVCSGEVLTAALALEFFDVFQLPGYRLCNFYGSTEVMGDVTYALFQSKEEVENAVVENKVPIGVPVDNCIVYLLDKEFQPVRPGEIGEIFIAGAHLASGYVNRREAHRFLPNPFTEEEDIDDVDIVFRTGDYGRLVGETLLYEGRSDSQVKIRGHRVDVNEINRVLTCCKSVDQGLVLCYQAGLPEQDIVAFVIPKEKSTPADVYRELKTQLMSYMMPKVIPVQEIPLLVNGKVDRQSLLKLYEDSVEVPGSDSTLRWDPTELEKLASELQAKLVAIFKTTLSVVGYSSASKLSVSDNYFDVGGNSLNAVVTATRLRDQGYSISLGEFLSAQDFLHLAVKLDVKESVCDEIRNHRYVVEVLTDEVKEEVIHIICTSFSQKAELELLTGVVYEDYVHFMNDIWDPLVSAKYSFTLQNADGQIVAVALNFDVFDEPPVEPREKRLAYVFEFLEHLEAPIRESRFDRRTGSVLHSFMMATAASVSAADNIQLIQIMEDETLELARSQGFTAVFTTNSNQLTQQICDDVLKYQVLHEFQVNQYTAGDGTRPFAEAPDSLLAAVTVKYITQ